MPLDKQDIDEDKLEQFMEKALTDLGAGNGGAMVSLGHGLGLYKATARAGPLSPPVISTRSLTLPCG